MPSKNEVKTYCSQSYYHIYNRGVEKRIIFLDEQDYLVFLSYLKTYLLPKDEKQLREILANPNTRWDEKNKVLKLLQLNNFYSDIKLHAFCLMSNHFHMLIYQEDEEMIDKFMNSLCTRYSMYFNKKYKRVGPLFQGVYKAVLVETDEQLLHLSRYIHYQSNFLQGLPLEKPQPSSYTNYIGTVSQEWVKPDEVLGFFKYSTRTKAIDDVQSYQSFVEEYKDSVEEISRLTIDEEEE